MDENFETLRTSSVLRNSPYALRDRWMKKVHEVKCLSFSICFCNQKLNCKADLVNLVSLKWLCTEVLLSYILPSVLFRSQFQCPPAPRGTEPSRIARHSTQTALLFQFPLSTPLLYQLPTTLQHLHNMPVCPLPPLFVSTHFLKSHDVSYRAHMSLSRAPPSVT